MEDWSREMEEFKEVIPDAMDFERWLVERQKTYKFCKWNCCRNSRYFLQSISWVSGEVLGVVIKCTIH